MPEDAVLIEETTVEHGCAWRGRRFSKWKTCVSVAAAVAAGWCSARAQEAPYSPRPVLAQSVPSGPRPVLAQSVLQVPVSPDSGATGPQGSPTDATDNVQMEQPAGQAGPGSPKKEAPKPFWATHPPVTPYPRTGWFLMPPTGPGYYSLKDLVVGEYRQAPPKSPYPPVSPDFFPFFEADFRYLDDPKNKQFDWTDAFKRMHLGDDWLLTFGGEERIRYMNEEHSGQRLIGKDNEYSLERTRVFGDLWYRDNFRIYVEFIDAQSFGQDLPPLKIDENHSDLLNIFADLKLFEIDDHPVYLRGGRQELCYGSQRLISPLDWANTRRTFQGFKGFWHGDKLDIDAFWVQPIIIDPTHFDSPDDGQQFAGSWLTYHPRKGESIDLYYLYLENTRPIATGEHGAKGGFNVSTIGSRYAGDYQHFLYDFEGMYQFGDYVNQSITAGAVTTGLGYQFANVPMNPQFWVYNDFASGDHSPGTTTEHGTFNQLFPFGHFYFGFIDAVGRQNIDDLNFQFVFFPKKWITSLVQYHIFRLDSAKDALYGTSGAVLRRDPTGKSGTDVGDEIDLVTNFHMSPHQDILVGYSKLFAGEFIRNTGPGFSPELFYIQYSFKW